MARNLVTVCLFCLLCATHTTCDTHLTNEKAIESHDDVTNLESHHRIDDKRLQQKNHRYNQKLSKIRSHKLENDHSNSEIDVHSDSYATPIDSYAKPVDSYARTIDSYAKPVDSYARTIDSYATPLDNYARTIDSYAKPIDRRKRHVDIDSSQEYIEQIFRLYGNPDSMTMNLTGFNQMLRVLDLHKMIDGGEHKVHSLRTAGVEEETVRCIDSTRLISTLNQESKPKPETHSHSHDHNHGHEHAENLSDPLTLTAETLRDVCPILLFQKVANTSLQRTGCILEHNIIKRKSELAKTENAYTKNTFSVWLYSSLSIVAISACGLFGVAVIPIMHKTYYNHLLQFLVALAVGTLCGDALLHLLPHAMSPMDDEDASSHSHDDSMWKGLAAMLGVVFFYFMEKGLTVIVEWRKRRQKLKEDKLPSRVRVLKDDPSGGSGNKGPFSSSSLMKVFKKEDKTEGSQKTCKHKYSEYPYCYDEIETDTHDDHHMRDGQLPPSPKNKAVSVVSSNALNQESKDADPSAKDWLLKPESGLAVEMNNIKHKDDSKELKGEESYTVILREHSRNHHGHSHSHGHVHAPPSSMSSVAWMVIMGDGLHNFTDGMAIGAAFASNIAGGFSTAIAVLCHELPHELGDFAVLLKAGMSVRRAVCYNILSSALCLAGMVCGVLLGHAPSATRWLFAIAAGTFLYIALVDMMPELSTSHSKEGTLCQCILQLMGLATGIGVMLVIALYEHDLKNLFG